MISAETGAGGFIVRNKKKRRIRKRKEKTTSPTTGATRTERIHQ
jgi:hypothetical protein